MYSVFVVDDEPIVLEGIRSKIDWESSGFAFAGEATDGEIALSMLHEVKPDILITDIKMPFMDGLQLAQAVKRIQPWIKIIILSGHDEFDYAKKAISIGIEDYLLKPFTPDELLKSLQKTAVQIDKERKQLSDISRLKEELKSTEALKKKEFLNNLVHGSEDMSDVMQESQELGLNLISRFYKVLISRIKSRTDNIHNQEEACSLLNSYSASWEQAECFFHHSNLLVCIFKGSTREELDESIFHAAEAIAHIATKNDDCTVLTTIGKTVEHLSQLNLSYEDAKKILEMGGKEEKNRIISSEDLEEGLNPDSNANSSATGILDLKENDPLVERLKYAGKNDISAIIDESMELIKNNPGQFSVFASYLLVDLIFAVSKLVEKLGGDIKKLKPEILQRKFIDDAVGDEKDFRKKVEQVLSFALEYRDSKMTGKYGDVILKAKRYIEEHYADQNTTLTTVAEAVALSPNHFSTIFSQECKTTFIEYLTNVRLENAKRLMRETEMKGYDIAYECGFSDPHYFSYIFKKNTGLSPREYRLSF
ncbi:MAG: response regulator [Treponema sp.]|uniref:response regulator transcription factor n=1 Tax=Treponema sp. TaxID=166 RepID=UPI0025EE6F70|nr:response regulator [Treponema sp.]MBR0496761.1 response regulator [Treponema sp.]